MSMKRKSWQVIFAASLLLLVFKSIALALVITPTGDPEVLVSEILGSGVSVVPGSETYTGKTEASGIFIDGAASGLVIENGIILTSGEAVDAAGPNLSTSTSTNLRAPGDPDLDILSGLTDLTFKFDKQEIVKVLGTDLEDSQCIRLNLSGNLLEEFGGTPLVGEDGMVIRKK